jgi:hypothetical protein
MKIKMVVEVTDVDATLVDPWTIAELLVDTYTVERNPRTDPVIVFADQAEWQD